MPPIISARKSDEIGTTFDRDFFSFSERTPRSFEMKAARVQEKNTENAHDADNLSPRKLSVLYEAMENAELEQAILRVPLFSVLTHSEVSVLVKCLRPIIVNNGEYIYRQVELFNSVGLAGPPFLTRSGQGDEGDTFFVIFKGASFFAKRGGNSIDFPLQRRGGKGGRECRQAGNRHGSAPHSRPILWPARAP